MNWNFATRSIQIGIVLLILTKNYRNVINYKLQDGITNFVILKLRKRYFQYFFFHNAFNRGESNVSGKKWWNRKKYGTCFTRDLKIIEKKKKKNCEKLTTTVKVMLHSCFSLFVRSTHFLTLGLKHFFFKFFFFLILNACVNSYCLFLNGRERYR